MEKKKILFIVLMIIACFGITGCQNNNTQKEKIENDVNEPYEDENGSDKKNESENENKEIFTITFDSDGGTPVEQMKVTAGEKIAAPTAPTKEGYKFLGWYNGETPYDFTTSPNQNIVLKAKWEKTAGTSTVTPSVKTYTVTFNSNGGSTVDKQTVKEGAKATKPANPTKGGYTFVGWELNGKIYNFNTKVTKNITLKAMWILTPKITEAGFGAESDGTIGKQLSLDSMEGITGVQIYSSTSENGTYTLLKTVKKEDWNETASTVYAQKGQHLYFKVKTYVKNDSGTYYSAYSNAIEINNL